MARPDGVKLVAAMADDPKSLAAIASLENATARSAALVKFAASLPKQRRSTPPDDATYQERVRFWESSCAAHRPTPFYDRRPFYLFVGTMVAIVLIILGATFGPNTYQPEPRNPGRFGGHERPVQQHIESPMESAH
jgi:hypothetical protein